MLKETKAWETIKNYNKKNLKKFKKSHPPDETEIKTLQASARREKDGLLKMQCEQVRESLPSKTERAVELATEKEPRIGWRWSR